MTRPNGVNTNYTYDSLSRLLSVLHQNGSTTIDGATYSYDAVGNRTSKTNHLNAVIETYGYDNIYQLLTVLQGSTTTESYTYDKVGNRLSSLGGITYTVNNSNQLTSQNGSTYTYDNNGNTLTKVDGAGTTTYTWNSQNQLTQVSLPGGATVSFKYDPFGRRVQKVSASGTINYLHNGDNVIEELDSAGLVIAKYVQGEGIDEPLAIQRGVTRFYEADGLGSITSLTDSTGSSANGYTFESFGRLIASTGTFVNPSRYTAREFDVESDIYYYRARYYDNVAGRFLSEDPLRFDATINFYSYTGNNPINATDPSGRVIKICSRDGWEGPVTALFLSGGVANHAYLYDSTTGRNCGRGDQNGKENPSAFGTFCRDVPGSDGHEEQIMECCQKTRNQGTFFPVKNDCHTSIDRCIKAAGLSNPGAPGGRLGCRGRGFCGWDFIVPGIRALFRPEHAWANGSMPRPPADIRR